MSGKDAMTCENSSGNEPGSSTTFEPTDWEARLAEQMAGYALRQAARKAERDEFKRRRDYGLTQRHARKTARNQQENQP